MTTIYEHTSRGGCEDFHVLLEDDRVLNIHLNDEGIIMDVFENLRDGPLGTRMAERLGTAGMTFDEWADWVVNRIDPSLKIGESVY